MISKYPGTCRYCKQPTKAGKDQYDLESRTGYHAQCEEDAENEPPSAEQFALAARLGFIGPGEEVPSDWTVWCLPAGNHGGSTGRPERAAHQRSNGNLFGED